MVKNFTLYFKVLAMFRIKLPTSPKTIDVIFINSIELKFMVVAAISTHRKEDSTIISLQNSIETQACLNLLLFRYYSLVIKINSVIVVAAGVIGHIFRFTHW